MFWVFSSGLLSASRMNLSVSDVTWLVFFVFFFLPLTITLTVLHFLSFTSSWCQHLLLLCSLCLKMVSMVNSRSPTTFKKKSLHFFFECIPSCAVLSLSVCDLVTNNAVTLNCAFVILSVKLKNDFEFLKFWFWLYFLRKQIKIILVWWHFRHKESTSFFFFTFSFTCLLHPYS